MDLELYIDLFPVFVGSAAHTFLEETAEMLRILESEGIGNPAHCIIRICDAFFGNIDYFILDIVLRSLSGFFLEQVAEIVG